LLQQWRVSIWNAGPRQTTSARLFILLRVQRIHNNLPPVANAIENQAEAAKTFAMVCKSMQISEFSALSRGLAQGYK